jgi:preprotein translocase subunit SecG
MLSWLLHGVHIFVCLFLILVVLLQQGRGGGMGGAFGGGAAQQVFGGRGAGNLLTRATAVCATLFMLTSVGLAYLSSAGDRELKDRVAEEKKRMEATPRPKEEEGAGGGAAGTPPAPSEGTAGPGGATAAGTATPSGTP